MSRAAFVVALRLRLLMTLVTALGMTLVILMVGALFPAVGDSSLAESCDDLHLCGSCGSELVYPVEWDEAGATHWEVTLRCPNCEWAGTGVFEQTIVERFDEVLDRGTEALVRDLKRMMHANMEDEIERFVTALDADHILPDDF